MVTSNSKIISWSQNQSDIDKAKHIHIQLYQNSYFHEWMQETEAVRLKLSNNHIYIHCPRSWYDWVILETYRNEIGSELINKFSFTTSQKCFNANLFWGANIEFTISKPQFIISAEFDDIGDLRIGVKDNGKSILENTTIIQTIDQGDGWLIRKKYPYIDIATISEINTLIIKINDEIFDESKTGSILNTLK